MNMVLPTRENLCAVIVTYHPDQDFLHRLNILLHQLAHVVIVDNHSNQDSQKMLDALMIQGRVHVIFNQDNLGIAAALNQGISWAKKQGSHWVLTLDQDSCLEESGIEAFVKIYNGLENKENIAMVGLNHIDTNSRQTYYKSGGESEKAWVERKTLISSGSFLSLQAMDHIGSFQEDLFIDGVEHEYCLRARQKGYRNILILAPLLKHAMGHRTIIQPPFISWIKIPLTNYPPFRWYFMTRNRLIICREYLCSDFFWCIQRFCRLLGSLVLMLMFEQRRTDKLKFVALGLKDGLQRNLKRKITFPSAMAM
jgi:rhamnosyltransferase